MREKVTITLLASIPVMGIQLPSQRLTFVIGEATVVAALDMAVTRMDVGEVAEILTGFEYMYGKIGLPPDIPPNANFKLYVTLHSSVPFDYKTLDFPQKFEEAALKTVDPSATKMCDVSADQLQQVLEFRSVVNCNLSASLLKSSDFEDARQSAEEAIKIQPSHAKAYLRLGQAQDKLRNAEEAIQAYKKALSLDVTNQSLDTKWLHKECTRLSKVSQTSKEDQQKMYSKMFWGSNPPPATPQKADTPQNKEDQQNINNPPPVNKEQKETPIPSSVSSFWKKTGLGLVGAGIVGLVGFGIYKYLNR